MIDRFEIVTSKSARPDAERIVFCDGSGGRLFNPATDLELSHWRPNQTPPEYRGDTSTEACFRFLENPRPGPWMVAVNNHTDVDGILSVYTLVRSEHAREHRETIIAAAEMGDFWGWGEPAAQRVFQGITLLMNSLSQQNADYRAIYEQAFVRIPGLIDGSDPETSAIEASLEPLRRQASLVERGEIVRTRHGERFVQHVVPLTVAGDDDARAGYVPGFNEAISDNCVLWPAVQSRWDDERVRLVSVERKRGWFHALWYPGYLWADTERRWRTPGITYRSGMESYDLDHPALQDALRELQSLETADGTWAAGNGASPFHRELQSLFPVVCRFSAMGGSAGKSRLEPGRVASVLGGVFE
jgi:hypothetical protein